MSDRTSPADFPWYARAGLDALLDALAKGETDQAERIAFGLYDHAAAVEASSDSGTDRRGRP
jgi:hypothetical protein